MTPTVMEHGDDVPNVDAGPIVLTLNCTSAQRYLTPANQLLQALLGTEIVRVDINVPEYYGNLPMLLAHPEYQYQLLEDHQEMTLAEIRRMKDKPVELAIMSAAYILRKLLDRFGDQHMDRTAARVKVVLIHHSLLAEGSVLRKAIGRSFPNAAYFRTIDNRMVPTRVWKNPLCLTCSAEMSPAGDAFVCQGCGSASWRGSPMYGGRSGGE